MPFEFDPAKARTNLRKHGVSFAHAEQALRDPMALTIEIPTPEVNSASSLWVWTRWAGLVVIHTQRGERTRLISARKASRGEADRYHA